MLKKYVCPCLIISLFLIIAETAASSNIHRDCRQGAGLALRALGNCAIVARHDRASLPGALHVSG